MSVDQFDLFGPPPTAPVIPAKPKRPAVVAIAPAAPAATPIAQGEVRCVRETMGGEKFGPNGERLPGDTPFQGYGVPLADEPATAPITAAPVDEPATVAPPPSTEPVIVASAPAIDPARAAFVITFEPLDDHECPVMIRVRTLLKVALREFRLRNVHAVMIDRAAAAAEVAS